MKLLIMTDIHGVTPAPRVETPPDAVLIVGDITHFGDAARAEATLSPLLDRFPKVLVVPGNCDRPDVQDYLERVGVCLHRKHVVMEGGLAIAGVGKALISPFKTPNEISDDEIAVCLRDAVNGLSPSAPLILMTHQPPFNTFNDTIGDGRHVGSPALRHFIEKRRPLICFTGHIHEAIGTDLVGTTPIVNPGPARNGYFALAEITSSRGVISLELMKNE